MFGGFWDTLPAPIIGLSPMDGVTDQPFRYIQQHYSQPDVIYTEFTAAEGVARNATKLFRDFLYDESQRPIVAQIFGKEPRAFYVTALILCYLGFDGIDINMGCPAKSVREHGSGAALIQTPKLAQEIIRATQRGVQDYVNGLTLDDLPELKAKTKTLVLERHQHLSPHLQARRQIPVTVKTRIGFDESVVDSWIPTLLETEVPVIGLHGRTLKQLYGGAANWDEIGRAKQLMAGTNTKLLGNGDLLSPQDVYRRVQETNVDGVLVGRATFGDPWILGDMIRARDTNWNNGNMDSFVRTEPTPQEMARVALHHAQVYEATFGNDHFLPMRKHLGWYIRGMHNAANYRTQLVMANSAHEVAEILQPLLSES